MTGSDWNDNPQHGSAGGPPAPQPAPQYPPPGQFPPPGAQYPPPGAQYPPPAEGGPAGAAGWPGPARSDTVEFSSGGHGAPAPGRKRLIVAGIAAAVVVVVVAVVAIAAAGGSGGSGGSQTPAQVLAAAAHKAASVNTLSATYNEKISGATGGSISGAIQEVRKPLQMSMTMTESIGGQTIPLSAILTDKSMFMKFGNAPGFPKAMEGKWIEFSLSKLGGGEFASMLQSVQNENPASQAQLLLASKHLRADGTQTIDGVQTTKYVGSFTPAAALKLLPASERAALAPAMNQVAGDIKFSVWIDGNDQIRQFIDVETVASESVTATFNFQSFNQAVTITTPPSSQVMHIPNSALGG